MQGLTTRIRRLLGALFGGRPVPPIAVTLTQSPAPINSAEDLETTPMRQAWALLEAKRGGRRFLARADIDPGEFKAQLPSMGLVEVHYQPLRFRIRLAGTEWRTTLGFEATGLWLEEWPNATQRAAMQAGWTAIVKEKRAGRVRRPVVVDGVALHYEAIYIPLAGDGETIDMLLIMSAPRRPDTPPWTADMPRR